MAYSKIILNGETLMDVTSDTVDAGNLLNGNTATKNNGTKVTGTYTPSKSPIFTLTYNSTMTEVQSVTCNKTYQECFDLCVDGEIITTGAIVKIQYQGSQETGEASANEYYIDSFQNIIYIIGIPPWGEIVYASNGTLTYSEPSRIEKTASDVIVNGANITVQKGYYNSVISKSVSTGIAGTPTASKGAVSNNSLSVTPSVTNTTGYITGGTKTGTAVSVSASELVSGTKSITSNGTSDVTNYASVNVNVSGSSSGGSLFDPVKFIDYDGTILYSYSVSDFMALTSMPSNPTHTGLISQGWNWSLADAKTQLTAYPEVGLTIGQMYVTSDGKTRLYVHMEDGRLSPYLGICPNGTVVVDWGDNSSTDTLTGTSLVTVQRVNHTYATAGDYIITLTVSSGSFAFYGSSSYSFIFSKSVVSSENPDFVYRNCIKKIEIGNNVNIQNYAFLGCAALRSITIPTNITTIGMYAFQGCRALLSISIPDGITSIKNYFCY